MLKFNSKIWCFLLLVILTSVNSNSQDKHNHSEQNHKTQFLFKQNKGQWNENVLYKTTLKDGDLYLENNGLTYSFIDKSFIKSVHSNNKPKSFPKEFKGHVVRVKFKGANLNPHITEKKSSPAYENYFIGDKSKWASNVKSFHEVYYKNVYNGIDFKMYSEHENLKYDFIVNKNADASKIKLEYYGADKMNIKNGNLYVRTSITDIVEHKPYAYQFIDGKKIKISCKYKLKNNILSFVFPKGYDKSNLLTIDPILVFSSYTGSSADNFGFTATYDANGFTYTGGIVFGTGYPTTTGAYKTSYTNGGTNSFGVPHSDVSISKFNADGSALIYSTYLGGNQSEAPHSLIVNAQNELFIFGTTGSSNFPTTNGAYDGSFAGGTNIFPGGSGIEYANGCDMFISKLSVNGTNLLASTFIGGSGNDGLNTMSGLEFNYGDPFRGEIIVDNTGNCIVASTTNSSNFPYTAGGVAYQGGGSDGVVFKLNSTLSNLIWGTNLGTSGEDSGYGIQLDALNSIFVTGGTNSSGFPGGLGGILNSYNGDIDGYLTKFHSSGAFLAARYIGTSSYDQSYLVQVDINDDVYVVGQSSGSMPVTAGKYNNANSGQFIQKYNNNLNILEYSTVIGRGSGNVDISPSAFLVNDCGLIYLSGWGGNSNSSVPSSTTSGLPITSNAYQSSTDGSDFYLMVLDKDATGLLYGTYFGGGTSDEHVDGGTSRFDKDGNVYQAVCAGCRGNSDFPTTPGAWSNSNGSTNCNLGVFKFNVDIVYALASVPQATLCWPNPVVFTNNSNGGNTYSWDFGDGNTSSLFTPSHSYAIAGSYTVSLIVSDSNGCVIPDTSTITIQIINPANAAATPDTSICPNSTLQLNSAGGTNYSWTPAATLSNPNIANPIASPTANTTYRVITTSQCGTDTAFVNVNIHTINTSSSDDTLICLGDNVQLNASGGNLYNWTPATNLSDPNISNPIASPTNSITYTANITTTDGCLNSESIYIEVDQGLPNPVITIDDTICGGETITLNASGARSYSWYTKQAIINSTNSSITVSPILTTTYFADYTNACGTITDSVKVTIQKPTAISSPDDTVCFNDTILLWAFGGITYQWNPSNSLVSPNNDTTKGLPSIPKTYNVIVTDNKGCKDTAYTTIFYSPIPYIDAGKDKIINFGEEVMLEPSHSNGTFYWKNHSSLSCTNCKNPITIPSTTTIFTANLIDPYGCSIKDDVTIFIDGVIYVPNTFSPNGDNINDVFYVKGKDITEYELFIFNRWGQLIFKSNNMDHGWDGKFKGTLSQTDTYIWKLRYSDVNTYNQVILGHINLIK